MFLSAPMTDSLSALAATAGEVVPEQIVWSGPEGQIIIATWVLTMTTLLVGIIEVYRLVKIDHQLTAIRRMLFAILHPMLIISERKIIRQAKGHKVDLLAQKIDMPTEAKMIGKLVIIRSESHARLVRKIED